MIHAIRMFLLKREIDRSLRKRRAITQARSEASQRGISTEWKRRGDRCRATFGGGI